MSVFWLCLTVFFFFQAEDGIRDYKVTGVQTCALPIYIVRDLLQFSRQRDFSPESADVNTVLEQVIAMVRRQGALNAITVEERYERDLPAVELDVSRIKQVFLNIINNAVYVMPSGGSLIVRTQTANGGVRIAFADTGPGIAPEHRDR